jgi:hypothetical protein
MVWLARDVVPRWLADGKGRELGVRLTGVPAVLHHQDLASYNILVSDQGFTVLDWEGARANGFPIWDVLHFLNDALARIERAGDSADRRDDYAARLFLGKTAMSGVLFRWVRKAVSTCNVDPSSVGALATAMWLSIATYHLADGERPPVPGSPRHRALTPSARMASIWLETPGLGLDWDRWRAD